jgi:hypothetical protein
VSIAAAAIVTFASAELRAQEVVLPPAPNGGQSGAWDTATTILAASAAGLQLVMPRVFYADPEVTAGWKARWHLSVLAPVMTITTVALLNETTLKDSFASPRPNCEGRRKEFDCRSFGMLSTHTFVAFSAVGHGVGIFLSDSLKWSDGRFNAGSFTGEVAVPFVLALITAVGRTSGNWESGAQVWESAGFGAGIGLGLGFLYASLQRPECGYTGNLICW